MKTKLIGLFFLIVGFSVAWQGVVEFDKATSSLPLFRGLFWLLVGVLCISGAVDRLLGDKK